MISQTIISKKKFYTSIWSISFLLAIFLFGKMINCKGNGINSIKIHEIEGSLKSTNPSADFNQASSIYDNPTKDFNKKKNILLEKSIFIFFRFFR